MFSRLPQSKAPHKGKSGASSNFLSSIGADDEENYEASDTVHSAPPAAKRQRTEATGDAKSPVVSQQTTAVSKTVKPSAVSTEEAKKKKKRSKKTRQGQNKKKKCNKRGADDGVIVSNLPSDLRAIYGKTVQHLAPHVDVRYPIVDRSSGDSAILVFTVASEAAAHALHKRLHNMSVYGRTWKADIHRAKDVDCDPSPSVVDVRLSAPLPDHTVETVLSSLPGFLAVTRNEHGQATQEATSYVATFADEGSALHARAVLSGRKQEGAHMFLARRPQGTVTAI